MCIYGKTFFLSPMVVQPTANSQSSYIPKYACLLFTAQLYFYRSPILVRRLWIFNSKMNVFENLKQSNFVCFRVLAKMRLGIRILHPVTVIDDWTKMPTMATKKRMQGDVNE